MGSDDEAGEQLLALLLEKVRGFTPLPGAEQVHTIADNVRCRVPGCTVAAIFRCSSGWRYCAKHVRVHGPLLGRHSVEIIRSSRAKDVSDAGITLERRSQARDFGPEVGGHA